MRRRPLLALVALASCAVAVLLLGGRPPQRVEALPALQATSTLTLAPTSGKVGTTVTATLAGFGASESIGIYWDGATTAIKTVTASATGAATTTFVVPDATKGNHTVTGKGATSGASATATFAVTPSLALSPTAGTVGATVTVTLKGYAAGEAITLNWYASATTATALKSVTASATGSVSTTFVVPAAVKGGHKVEGVGGGGSLASATFTVNPKLTLSSTTGVVGATVNVTLSGYGANEAITLNWYDTATTWTAVKSVTASATGDATASFIVPEGIKGSHKVEGKGAGGSLTSATYTLNPSLSLSPASGPTGTSVAVTLKGYAANEALTINWYTTATTTLTVANATASALGSATAAFDVPAASDGSYKVEGVGGVSLGKASANFLVAAGSTPGAPACVLSPATGAVGTSVKVSCANFQGNETVRIYWDSTATVQKASFVAAAAGDGSATFMVPDAVGGSHPVIAVGATSGTSASAAFTVTPSLALSPTAGAVGANVTVTLKGYAASEVVTLKWYATSTSATTLKSVTASATGTASTTFVVPDSTKGGHKVEGAGAGGSLASATFTVNPSLTLSPTSGVVGATVTVTLKGYAASEAVALKWYEGATATTLKSVTVSATGSATTSFVVPDAAKNGHKVEGAGAGGGLASATFTVNPSLTLSPSSGPVGATVSVTLKGFAANEALTVNWYATATTSTVVATATASSLGGATVSFAVPTASDGSYKVEGVGGTSAGKASANFLVAAGSSGGGPTCALTPASGKAGTSLNVSCAGFQGGEIVRVYWDSAATVQKASFVASATGDGSATFAVPDAAGGDHPVIARGATSGFEVSKTFTITPSFTLSSASGTVGSNVTATFKGYGASETVNITWDGGTTPIKTATTSATGTATVTFAVPEAPKGAHTVTGKGATSQATGSANYTVTPSLALSPTSGVVGATVTVTLKGYAANETITLKWYSTTIASTAIKSVTASALGSATTTFQVPEAIKNGHKVEGAGAAGSLASATFTVNPSLTLSPTSGPVGTGVTVTLKGYAAGETITVKWYNGTTPTTLGTVAASSLGSATYTFTVAEATSNGHKVEGAGGTSLGIASATFSVGPSISLSPTSGSSGSPVGVTLKGYAATATVHVKWYASSGIATTVATVTTSAAGSATTTFNVPSSSPGTFKVEGAGLSIGQVSSTNFTVGGGVSLSPTSGPVGTSVTLTVEGYAANENITIKWYDTATTSTTLTTVKADATGKATATFTVPTATGGAHKVEAVGSTTGATSATFTVTARLRLSPASGPVGATVNVTLDGYGASETVNITWDGGATPIKSVTTSPTGDATTTFTVPPGPGGTRTVTAKGATSGATDSELYAVAAGLTLSPTSGPVGTSVSVNLVGYAAGEAITVKWYNGATATNVATATADAAGSATATFTVPDAAHGGHKVEGAGLSLASATFTVGPSLALEPTTGAVGASVTVTLKGYGAGEAIAIKWYDTPVSARTLTSVTASTTGAATATIAVPSTTHGPHKVEGVGATSGAVASATFAVNERLTLAPAFGAVGSTVTITLEGYGANEVVGLAWDGAPLTSVTVSALGEATTTFTVPAAVKGDHTIVGTGVTTQATASTTFTVTPAVVLSPKAGPPGTAVTVTLSGYVAGDVIDVTWRNADGTTTSMAGATADATGSATATFTVPQSAEGDYLVEGNVANGSSASTTFTIFIGRVTLSPTSGPVGTTVTVTLEGYTGGETLNVKWYDTPTSSTTVATVTALTTGITTTSFVVPEAANGGHTVEGAGTTSGATASATFSVAPTLSLSPTSGTVGATVNVTLKGYGAGETVDLFWDNGTTPFKSVTVSATGSATSTFAAPEGAKGSHTVTGTGATSGASASATYAVGPSLSLNPATGPVGASVTVSLTGYAAGEAITVQWYNGTSPTTLSTVTASSVGSATYTLTVPASVKGAHKIEGTGNAGSLASATFTVVAQVKPAPDSAIAGSTVSVNLDGFAAGESVDLTWDGPTTSLKKNVALNASGSGTSSFVVPEAPRGTHTVIATGSAGTTATATFTVVPSMTLSATSGTVGTSVTATLKGYAANETITIKWYNGATATDVATATASALGSATAAFTVPEASKGAHTVEGAGAGGGQASATYTVTPSLTLAPTSGTIGTSLTVTMKGYAADEAITVKWFDTTTTSTTITTATASVLGSATATFQVPTATAGGHKVEGAGAGGSIASATFTLNPSLSLSPSSGPVGSTVTVTLKGYAAGETVNIKWDNGATPVKSVTTTAAGTATTSFVVPDAAKGSHTVSGTGATSAGTASAPFAVTPSLSLSPTSGAVGSSVTVTLKGYGAGEVVTVKWYEGASTTNVATVTASATGSAAPTFVVPAATKGTHQVEAAGAGGSLAAATFTVTTNLVLLPPSGLVGASVTVTLNGYAAGETVDVFWDSGASPIASVTTSAAGGATTSFPVPEVAKGNYTVTGTGATSGATASATFGVTPSLALSPTNGKQGTSVAVTLKGYAANEVITVKWYDTATAATTLTTVTASATGSATAAFDVPVATNGAHKVEATGSAGSLISTTFTVNASLVLSPTAGTVGSTVTVTLEGYGASETVNIKWDNGATPVKSVTTSATGSATTTFAVPDGAKGSHTVSGTGATSAGTASAPFAVEPSLSLSRTSGGVGATVTVTLKGYGASETVNITWDGGATPLKTITTSATGSATPSLTVPMTTIGAHTVTATGVTSGASLSATFTVTVIPGLTISPTSGVVGSAVTVTLTGYEAGETVDVTWDGGATPVATVVASAAGGATATFAAPEATKGNHTVAGVGRTSGGTASATFAVSPSLGLSAPAGPVGTSVTVTLRGYAAGEAITVKWYEGASTTNVATATASATGSATATFAVPSATKGGHKVEGTGTGGSLASATFTVNERVTVSPASGTVGSTLTVTLDGYGANENVDLFWDNGATPVKSVTTSATGGATTTFAVPEAAKGNHTVTGAGATSGASASATFAVNSSLGLAPTAGTVGTAVTVTLKGYAANEVVDVKWYATATSATTVTTVTASVLGSATATFQVPEATNGGHKVEGAGAGGSLASATFTVTPSIALAPTTGPVGATVTVTLKGYGAGETVSIKWDNGATAVASVVASATGSATTSFVVPAAAKGNHTVSGTGATSGGTASATFVVNPSIALAPTAGTVGASVTVTLRGYAASEAITVKWYNGATATTVASATASATGSATATFTVPEATNGGHQVEGAGGAGSLASTTFTVNPSIALTPTTGTVGTVVTVTLKGYAAGETIDIAWDGVSVKSIGASATGAATTSFAVPAATRGNHTVAGVGGTSGASASATFAVNPSMVISPTTGAVGSTVTVTLNGYGASETVNVTWDGGATPVKSVTTSPTGGATTTFAVPDATKGNHTVAATGATSGATVSATFAVNPSLALSPTSGGVGTSVTVTLNGYGANQTITVKWYNGGTATTLGTVTASPLGSATYTFAVPEAVKGGHTVEGSATGNTLASATFTLDPSVSLSAPSGPVGASVTVTLKGYAASEAIAVKWYEGASATTVANVTATAAGSASATFSVPEASNGGHQVEGAGGASSAASATFTVNPSLSLSPTSGTVGASVTVTLKGYGAGETVGIRWDGATVKSVGVSATGGATTTFAVPDATKGNHTVAGVGGTSGASASATFTVNPSLTLSPTGGLVESTVTVTLAGYGASETVNVKWDNGATPVTSATTSATGSATATFQVPAATKGNHTVSGTGVTSGATASGTFTVNPSLTLSANSGTVGTSVTVTLKGYAASEAITVKWYNGGTATTVATATATAAGSATATFTVPEAFNGGHKVEGAGGGGSLASATFSVTPSLSLNPGTGPVGATVTITLKGYAAGETVNVTWDGGATPVTSVAANASGSASTTFAVPAATDGNHAVAATGATSGATASATFLAATPPDTSIADRPANPSNSTTASFTYTSTEAGSTFACRLDGAAFATCPADGTSYTSLADGTHTVEVRATDPAGNTDPTPAAYAWTVDTAAPDTTITSSGPTNPSASADATFAFSASETGSTFECRLDGGAYQACTSPKGYPGLGNGSHTFEVRAKDAAGNVDTTSASRTWTIDTVAPETTITSAPSALTNATSATFEFSSDETSATFACSLDGGAFAACVSPKSFTNLANGTHTFEVVATDAAGNADLTAASRTWTVDTTAPQTSLTSTPSGVTNATSATFAYSSSEDGSTFACSLDGAASAPCGGPGTGGTVSYNGLTDGSHTVEVSARDAAGNTDSTAASHTWIVDTTAPQTTIASGPPTLTSNSTATFEFSSDEGNTSFACALDGGASAPCVSPVGYTNLPDGPHSFSVAATDAASNADLSPAGHTWTVDATVPTAPSPSATAIAPTQVDVTWSPSSDSSGVVGYDVYRDGALLVSGVTGTAYSDTAVAPSTTYSYTVRAKDAAGNASPFGGPATVTTPAPPDTTPPSAPSLTASATSPTPVDLSWTASTDDGSGLVGYRIYRDGALLTTVDAGTTVYADASVAADTTYTYRVVAVDAAGNEAWSNAVEVTTPIA